MNPTNSLSVNSSDSLPIITTFVNSDMKIKVRSVVINNEPYFVGKDVAEILGYSNSRKAISDHVDDEDKGVTKWNTLGGNQDLTIINESGLYSLILSSKLPSAKKIKHWVTSEVLPSIRKNGSYSVPKTYAEALQLAANQAKQIEEMQPKADVYDKICNSESLKPVDQVASNLGFGKNNFFALMRGMGIFYYSSADADGKRVNLPKQEYKDRGYFVTKEEPYNRGDKDYLYTKIYVTGKGEKWLAKKLGEERAESFLKAPDKMLEKELMHKAIINNPESDKTIFNTYSLMQVAKLSGETVETIINYCQLQKYFDKDGKPTLYGTDITGYITRFGSFTENGKNAIVSVFLQIKNAEKGMRKTEYGKAE